MSIDRVPFEPTCGRENQDPAEEFLESLFRTVQESWSIHLYLQVANCFEPVSSIVKEMGDQHLAVMAKILETQHSGDNDNRYYDSIESFDDLDAMLVNELKLRSKLLSVLLELVCDQFPSQFEWDSIANALDYVSRIHSTLIQRLRFLRQMMEDNSNGGKATGSICLTGAA